VSHPLGVTHPATILNAPMFAGMHLSFISEINFIAAGFWMAAKTLSLLINYLLFIAAKRLFS
jgi:hypothetical protein